MFGEQTDEHDVLSQFVNNLRNERRYDGCGAQPAQGSCVFEALRRNSTRLRSIRMGIAWISRVDYQHNRRVSQEYRASWRIFLRALRDRGGDYRARSRDETLSKRKSFAFRAPLVSVAALHFPF